MNKFLFSLSLVLLLTGCDQEKRADYESFAVSCAKNNGIIVKTLSYSKTYLFGVIPITTGMSVFCQINPTVGTQPE